MALDVVPRVALTLTATSVVTASVSIVNVVEVPPAGTTTDSGTRTPGLVDLSRTVPQPAGAGSVNVTVP